MAGPSSLEWTDETCATPVVDRGGRRVRFYVRKTLGPTKAERRVELVRGFAWCRGCVAFVPAVDVRKGACREHRNAEYRARYAAGAAPAIRARVHARKRNVAPVPPDAWADIVESFGGECAYCPAAASPDHLIPVSRGGRTEPWNIVPACVSCNSAKGARALDDFLARRPDAKGDLIVARIVLEHCGLGAAHAH